MREDKMDISRGMVEFYLNKITDMRIIEYNLPADNLCEYDLYIEDVKNSATYYGDLEALKLALEYILANSNINASAMTHSEYDWDDEEVREVIHYLWRKIWPGSELISAENMQEVKLVDTSLQEWWAQNKKPQ